MVDNLLPDHVELPHVLDLAVHLVQLMTWMGRGGHTETFSLSAHGIMETPQSPWFWGLGIWGLGDWGQGLSILASR